MVYQIIKACPSLQNLQRCYFPANIPSEHYGKYAFLSTSTGKKYFIRICVKPLLQNNLCILDNNVHCCFERELSEYEVIDYDNLSVISSVKYIKTLYVSLVFKTVWDLHKWFDNCSKFNELFKEILQLFVLVNNVNLNICDLHEINVIGIHTIVINNIGSNAAGKVVENTKIVFDNITCFPRFSLNQEVAPTQFINGLTVQQNLLEDHFKSFLNTQSNQINLKLNTSLKVLVIGPDGCGKKSLVRFVAQKYKAVIVSIDGPELSRPLPGETERLFKEKFDEAVHHSKEGITILLILRIESVCSKDGRILSEFLFLLDSLPSSSPLIVIATTSKPHLLHESLRSSSRFQNRVFINIPTEEERCEMIYGFCDGILSKESVQIIAKKTPGFVLADISLLISRAKRLTHSQSDIKSSETALFEALNECIYQIQPSSVRGELGIVKADKFDIKELGGLSTIKKTLVQCIQWPLLHPEAFQRLNIKKSSGVLLYGPPGCAKTSLVKALATSSHVTFLSVSAADLYSPFVGDAEITITNLFQRARDSSPSILFIDEIDALVGSREEKHRGAQERILSTFLVEMDGIGIKTESLSVKDPIETKVTVIAATNRPDSVDPALLRPGRLDRLIYVPPPSIEDRLEILNVLTERVPLSDNVDLNYVAEKTHLFSGADLKSLCQEAALQALTQDGMDADIVKPEHWLKALEEIQSSLTQAQVDWYNKFTFSALH